MQCEGFVDEEVVVLYYFLDSVELWYGEGVQRVAGNVAAVAAALGGGGGFLKEVVFLGGGGG